jgi:type II secretory pathway pseudopilin PulG
MAELNICLKASTLVESLIAMVILVLCLGIATMVFANVLNSDRERKQLNAAQIADQEVLRAKQENNFLDAEYEVNRFIVKKTVEKYEQTENLFLLSLTVLDPDRKPVYTRRELIVVDP